MARAFRVHRERYIDRAQSRQSDRNITTIAAEARARGNQRRISGPAAGTSAGVQFGAAALIA